MKYKIDYSLLAEINLEKILLYIAKESGDKEVARKFFSELTEKISILAENPYLFNFPSEDILRYKGKRQLVFGNYNVYFSINEKKKQVQIATIRHGARVR